MFGNLDSGFRAFGLGDFRPSCKASCQMANTKEIAMMNGSFSYEPGGFGFWGSVRRKSFETCNDARRM